MHAMRARRPAANQQREDEWRLTPQPNLKKTPSGGRMMARMMSMQVAVPSDISSIDLVYLGRRVGGRGEKISDRAQIERASCSG